ncbi:MAG TPA: efflux RND transporter periplasmic adaptor subunit [Candidatus Binataceae bacterium]|nr:efflux RND transporter periplasmic adaptor subunit [Candidatus Binataceae bacterium]
MASPTTMSETRALYAAPIGARRTRMIRSTPLLVAAIILICAGAYFFRGSRDATQYLTEPATRGPIVRTVTATGTVNPVTTVQVGTYVSGPISAIYVDFNSAVKAGQLLAKIDPRPFQAQVDQTTAALANARAQLGKDEANLAYQKITAQRDSRLLREKVISQDQMDSQESSYQQAVAQIALDRAAIEQQAANLKAAQLNLYYTNIISPVDGIVVSRNVDVGQTVAASYQTPTLFLVAKDLTKMQVDTNVSESDIGSVRVGQPVEFTVDAYTTELFKGSVVQVRQAPITVQNVVTYDVVVGVANPDLRLMPGMTANITIVSERRNDALRVPLRALAFSPRQRGRHPDSADNDQIQRAPRIWIEQGGRIHPVNITRGIDDGNYVEVLSGDVKPGDAIVTDRANGSGAGPSAGGQGPGMHFIHM